MAPHPALARQDHRPWPIPTSPWTWRQSWCDLLFAHWPVPAEALAATREVSEEHDEGRW